MCSSLHGCQGDHGDLVGLADDDHPQYGALAQAEIWTARQRFDAGIRVEAGDIQGPGGDKRIGFDDATTGVAVLLTAEGAASGEFTAQFGGLQSALPVPIGAFFVQLATESVVLDDGSSLAGGVHTLAEWNGAAALTNLQAGFFSPAIAAGMGAVTNMSAIVGRMNSSNLGAAPTNARAFWARIPTNAWGTAIKPTLAEGLDVDNQGRASAIGAQITTVRGVRVAGQRAATDAVGVLVEDMVAGTNQVGFWQQGTGDHNRFAGSVLIGADAAPEAGVGLELRNDFLLGAFYQEAREMTAPAAPGANGARIYAQDNGAGKTQVMALFNTGAAQQIAIEP